MQEEPDSTPKHRVEHAVSGLAGCQAAACKRSGVKIVKGELRIGTWVWLERDDKHIWQWRHWGCATPRQIETLKAIAKDIGKLEDAPGYAGLSQGSQEQVLQAFEEGSVVDKHWKDIREDLVKTYRGGGGEIKNAIGYKIEISSNGRAGCRKLDCKERNVKVPKGELRLGLAIPFDEDHASWVYKHWSCVTPYDINAIKGRMNEDSFDGLDALPEEHRIVVLESLEAGKALEAPAADSSIAKAPKKPRRTDPDNDEQYEPTAKRKSRNKRTTQEVDGESGGDQEAAVRKKRAPRKKKSSEGNTAGADAPTDIATEQDDRVAASASKEEEVNPVAARIAAMAGEMRKKAGQARGERAHGAE